MPKILRFAKLAKQINGDNLFYNGNFDIWQRGLSFNQPGFTADRWFVSMYTNETDSNENTITAKKVLSGGDIDNNSYAIRIENVVSGEYYCLSQSIPTEKVLPHQGEAATISYYARTPDSSFTGLLYGAMYSTPYPDNVIKDKTLISGSAISGTISSGWIQFSKTFDIPANAQSMVFEIRPYDLNLPSGTKLDITQTKLEIGSQASPFIPLSYSEELLRCEKFYQKISYASPLPNNNPNFTLTIPVKQRLTNTKLSTIKTFRDSSKNLVNKSISILDNNNLILTGQTSNSAANIDISDLVLESEIYPVDKPNTPTNIISLTGIINSGLVIQWSGSYDNGSPINYYIIDYGTSVNNLDESTVVDISGSHPSGTPTSGTISGLLENSQYYFQITAYNGFGSTSTNVLSHYFDQFPDPSAVINLTGTYMSSSTNLSWSIYEGSPIPTTYIIDRDISSNFNSSYLNRKIIPNTLSRSSARHLTSYSFADYDTSSSGTYYFRVSTVLNNITGVSTPISLTRNTPDKVINVLTTVNRNTNSINISWTQPKDNGAYITGYIIQYSTDSGNIGNGNSITVNNTTNTLIENLSANIEIFLRVAGLNAFGTGVWSDISSETPNRIPGTPSAPRNLLAYWPDTAWWNITNSTIDWSKSDDISDYVKYSTYINNGSGYNWPVSTAKIDWDSPTDNGGQSISYYTIAADTSSNYDSNNLKTYNTLFFRQTSALLINELLTTSTGTWYIKCAAVNPSGTGSYSTTTLFTSVPQLIYNISGSTSASVLSSKFTTAINNNSFNYAKSYFINSCGLPLLSGYALTGVGGSNPSIKNNYTSIFPDTRSDINNNPFEIYIQNIPPALDFNFKPVLFNAAGSGIMSRPITGDRDIAPYSPTNDFKALTYQTYTFTESIRPSITLRSTQSWRSSIGVGTFSGILYNGNPSTTGSIINNTFSSSNSFVSPISVSSNLLTLPVPTLTGVPNELWIKGNVILTLNNGTKYISENQNIPVWNRSLRVPYKPFIHSHGVVNPTGGLLLHHSTYTSSLVRGLDSLENMTYKVYLENYPDNKQNLNLQNTFTTVNKNQFISGVDLRGYHTIVAEISNSTYKISSSPSRVFFGYIEHHFIPNMNIVSTSTFGPLNTSSFPNTLRLQNLSSVILQGMPADVKTLVLNTRLTDFGRGTLATAYPQIICKALTTSITTLLYRGISQYVYRSLDTTGFLPNQYNLSISLFNSSNGIVSSEISLTSSIARTWTYNTQNFTLRNIYCGGQLIGWLLTS